MQINEIVGQIQQVRRLPDVDEAPIARRAMLETPGKRPGVGASRPVTTKQTEVAVGPKRNLRRFGAGF